MPAPKIVLDTNILIASIGTRSPFRWIFDCLISGKIILCVSNDILFEYHEILAEKANERVAENVVNFIAINPFTEQVGIYFNFGLISEDPSDNKFVDCAIASSADCLVTNDKHFRRLRSLEFPKVTVVNAFGI
jgi:putative PIN family toxin of toxin-antitoxin system